MAYGYTPGTMGICPTGWHLPTTTEFETLSSSVNNNGNALKSIGQGTGDGAGTNTSGFSSFLVGQRIWSGTFDGSTNIIFYWSSSEGGLSFSDIMYMYDNDNIINNNYYTKSYGLSIRCIKN